MTAFIADSSSYNRTGSCEVVGNSGSYSNTNRTKVVNSNFHNNDKIEESSHKRLVIDDELPFGFNEIENIDNMELEYAHEIASGIKKQLIKQSKYNKWTEALYRTLLNGDFYGFQRRFKIIMLCMRKRNPQIYKNVNNKELANTVAQSIVDHFHNIEQNTTILMVLLANCDKNLNCAKRGHGYCRISHMLMKLLKENDLAKLCKETAERSGKTALHLAVSTGHPCQLRVLLALADINPNLVDKSERAPIHYAVERNNLAMVKMLMWYGADISMVQSGNSKYDSLYISLHANPTGTVNNWLQERLKAISNKITKFTSNLVKKCMQIQKEISPCHFIHVPPFYGNSTIQIECQLNMHTNNSTMPSYSSSSKHNTLKNRFYSVLFLIPIAFQKIDELSAAADPKIVRILLPEGIFISGQPFLNSGHNSKMGNKLPHMFQPNHTGAFYAFKLTPFIESLHSLSFSLRSSTFEAGISQRNFIFAAQAFLCSEIDQHKAKLD